MHSACAAPVIERGRIRDLDVIRGGALIGVMWMNIYAITMWLVPAKQRDLWLSAPLDRLVAFGSEWLVGGKAQTLFGILFGFGFAVFIERATARGADPTRLYARRLVFLLALGLLHYGFVWWGDILHDYALVGLLLLLTRGLSDRTLLVLAIGCGIVAPPAFDASLVSHHALGLIRTRFHTTMGGAIHAGDYPAALRAIGTRTLALYGSGNGFGFASTLAGQFLFGAWVFRCGWLQQADTHRKLFRRLVAVTLPAGLVLSVLPLLLDTLPLSRTLAAGLGPCVETVATPVLAIGWASALVVAGRIALAAPLLGLLAGFGRMALTNYIAQSLYFIIVSDGFGLDLAWRVGLAANLAIGAGFVTLQIAGSVWWLRRYRFGPLEWLWRSATYGRWQPFRQAA